MNVESNDSNGGEDVAEKAPQRPTLYFERVEFSGGDTLEFGDEEIVVFVGPNNAGKSATLREMELLVARSVEQTVVKSASFRRNGTKRDFLEYLERHSQVIGESGSYRYSGLGFNIHHSHLRYFEDETERQPVASFFCTRLATENRITASNPANAVALFQDVATHPIHQLLMDDRLARKISGHFKHAFGQDLFPFRAGGSKFPLYVGRKPLVETGEDELSRTFVDKIKQQAVPLQEQGDGMRSFASVLLYILVADNHSIQFLDEPEAFLHPPQARLVGELIARERKAKSQLFIATHSTDILDGLISGGADKVRIVRIQRHGPINRAKELSREKTASIANDTLSRYSGVFSGIFYQHVVVCESDSDCLFYQSLMNTQAVTGMQRADILFIHGAGKARLANLASTLNELDVPVSVIADVDLLSDENMFKNLFETLGGEWGSIEGACMDLKKAIESRRPPLNAEQVSSMIRNELDSVGGVAQFPKERERAIKRILRSTSPWEEIKRAGRAALPKGQGVKKFDFILEKAASVGLFIVPVGELEAFCPSVDGGHGPRFVAKVLEERNLETDAELESARKFVSSILARARDAEPTVASTDMVSEDSGEARH